MVISVITSGARRARTTQRCHFPRAGRAGSCPNSIEFASSRSSVHAGSSRLVPCARIQQISFRSTTVALARAIMPRAVIPPPHPPPPDDNEDLFRHLKSRDARTWKYAKRKRPDSIESDARRSGPPPKCSLLTVCSDLTRGKGSKGTNQYVETAQMPLQVDRLRASLRMIVTHGS